MSCSSSSSTSSPSARSESLTTTNKRIRTSKPKVRSGCVTCKARRIKCDEIKPACDRCTKFGRECGGYKIQLTYEERVAARNGRSRILPKVYQASSISTTTNTTPSTHQLLQYPPNLHSHSHLHPSPPLSPSENYNLPLNPAQIFCIETSLSLCRTFDLPNWLAIKSSLSKQHPFLNHAFSAIRLLSKGPPPTPEYLDPQLSPQNSIHYHTHNFLSSSRHLVSTGPHEPLLASVICLLVITLETLQFHHEPALSHIQLGLALLPQLSNISNNNLDAPSPPFFAEEVIRAFQMVESKAGILDEYFRFYAPMPLGFGSPFAIVDELVVGDQGFCVAKEEFEGSLDGLNGGSVDGEVDSSGGFEGFVFVDGGLGGSGGGFGHSRGGSVVIGTP